jgi:hypothetical protein
MIRWCLSFGLSTLLLVGCVLDPLGGPQVQVQGPPLQANWHLPTKGSVRAAYKYGSILFLCTTNQQTPTTQHISYSVTAIELSTQKQLWREDDTLCRFQVADQHIFLLHRQQLTPTKLRIKTLDLRTGKFLRSFTLATTLCDTPSAIGTGTALLTPTPPDHCSSSFAIKQGYLLTWDKQSVQLYDHYFGKSAWELTPKHTTSIEQVTIHNGLLLLLLQSKEQLEPRINLSNIPEYAAKQNATSYQLRAYDIKTQTLVWTGTHLPPSLQHAQFHSMGNNLLIQIVSPYSPPSPFSQRTVRQKSLLGRGDSVYVYHFFLNTKVTQGTTIWQEPWIVHLETPTPNDVPLPTAIFQNDLILLQLGHRLYALPSNRPQMKWTRSLRREMPGRLSPFGTHQLRFDNENETFVFDKQTGQEQLYWSPTLLIPSTKTPHYSEKKAFTTRTECYDAEGVLLASTQTDPLQDTSQCASIQTLLSAISMPDNNPYSHHLIPLEDKTPQLTFLYEDSVLVLQRQGGLRSFQLP